MNLIKNLYMFVPQTIRRKIIFGLIGIGLIIFLMCYFFYLIGYMDASQIYSVYIENLENTCYCFKG